MGLRGWLMAGVATVVGLVVVAAAATCLTSGCSSVGYLAQSAHGHLSLLGSARSVNDWLAAPDTPEPLKKRLALSQEMRDFAVKELLLPDNRSYRTYADLKRTAAVWNVAAAPELSLQLETWCFPVVGCVGYRGFYDQAQAEAQGQSLRDEGLEVTVYGVPAYSTLGKVNWLGGDPLLNTFIGWSELDLARLIFHELAHQVVFAPGDTQFNESFATAVERVGSERWLARRGGEAALSPQARLAEARREQVRAMTRRTRAALDALYRSKLPDDAKRTRKAELMAALRAEHAALKAGEWAGYAGYDAFFEKLNNASLGIQGAYLDWVPAFEVLFEREGRDFARFYAAAKALADLPRAQRDATLLSLAPRATAP
jgi:predicted aminopeptidase